MSKQLRTTLAAALAALLMPALAQPAWAAAPSNDTPAGATPAVLGQTYTQDTSGATTDALDTALNQACGFPATDSSVWFTYSAEADGPFIVNADSRDYTVGVMIIAGDPEADGVVEACGVFNAGVEGVSGTTYYVMALEPFSEDPIGGMLDLTISPPPPPPTFALDRRGIAYKDGTAQVSGTYTCQGPSSDLVIEARLTQQVGRMKIVGYFYLDGSVLVCDGEAQPWSATFNPEYGLFAGGKATITLTDLKETGNVLVQDTIQLSRAKQK